MINVIAFFVTGAFLGFLLRKQKKIIGNIDRITNWTVYLLLFLLGLSVGANRTIIRNIGKIGIQALILALGAIAGSIVLSFVISKLLLKDRKSEK